MLRHTAVAVVDLVVSQMESPLMKLSLWPEGFEVNSMLEP